MIAKMSKVEIAGQNSQLQEVLGVLQDLGFFQIETADRDLSEQQPGKSIALESLDQRTVFERLFLEDLKLKIDQLLSKLPRLPLRESYLSARAAVGTVAYSVEHHLETCRALHVRKSILDEQREEFGRFIGFLGTLATLSRESPALAERDVIGLTLKDQGALERVRNVLTEVTGGEFKLFTVPAGDGTLSGLITVERRFADRVSGSLSSERVPEMSFPASFDHLTLSGKISFLEQRIAAIDRERLEIEQELNALCARWAPIYRSVRTWIDERLSLLRTAASIFHTKLCFFIRGWMPSADLGRLRSELARTCGERIVVEEKAVREEDMERVPSVLRNPPYFRPFEVFTRLLPLPNYSSYDPTPFIGIFFPIFFGMILGDAGYGMVLALVAFILMRKHQAGKTVGDAARILLLSSFYTVLFGILYGEFFGDLPHRLFGIEPPLIERSTSLIPMFIFALTVGTVHILFGLALGAVSAFRKRTPREGAYKVLSIAIILGMIAVIASGFGVIPALSARPVVLTILFLLPFLLLTGGLLAPLELLKSVGNIISYVRITAIGMTSVLLAYVANELGGLTGDMFTGIIVAALLHALNIVLGVFSPTIHALRLHFVEFFGKFVESGGRPFTPLGKG